MTRIIENLVFKGGGVQGIAYAGAIEALEKEGFTVMYSHVSSYKTEYAWKETYSEPYPEEIRAVNSEDYPLPMLSGGWISFRPKSKHITRKIELTWV
mgnify:CR=1 FL=1